MSLARQCCTGLILACKKKVIATVVLIEVCRIRFFFVIRVSISHLVLCQAANSDYKTFQDSVALKFL